MTFPQRQRLVEEVFEAQPNLLASVLCFHRRGVSDESLEALLIILLSCYEAVRASGHPFPMVSESVQEQCLAQIVNRVRFSEAHSPESKATAMRDQIQDHAEVNLLTLVMLQLQEHGLTKMASEADKGLVLCALNLAESIAHVLNEA